MPVKNGRANFSYNASVRSVVRRSLSGNRKRDWKEPSMQNDGIVLFPEPNRGWYLSRRSVLQRAVWAVAAAGISRLPALAADSVSPAMARLSAYMSEARNRMLPDDVTEKAKRHILDTFAAMVSGSELLPGQAALKFARGYGGEKVSTVICSNILCGPLEAALVNGVLGHSDE